MTLPGPYFVNCGYDPTGMSCGHDPGLVREDISSTDQVQAWDDGISDGVGVVAGLARLFV